jgi:hypothetical protein
MAKNKIYIGIDPGVNTGLAMNYDGILTAVRSCQIHDAMDEVREVGMNNILRELHIVFEDARQRNWFGKTSNEVLQGAGSIKRDCKIWEDFLTELKENGIITSFRMVAPKNNTTKLDAKKFNQITGWTKKTNEHSRDAAMLVFGL